MESTSTLGVAGYGLLLAPRCPCALTRLTNGDLVVSEVEGRVGPTARVSAGDEAATSAPPSVSGTSFRYGERGPTIALSGGATALPQLFDRIDGGLPDAEWNLLGPGFWIVLPPGLRVLTSAPGDASPFFELHLLSERGELVPQAFIGFQPRPVPAAKLKLGQGPGIEVVSEVVVQSPMGGVRCTEVAYTHEGVEWRRRYYVFEYGDETSLVMHAGAPVRVFARMSEAADRIAGSFELTE